MKPPVVPMLVGATCVVPSGRSSETLRLQQVGPTLMLTRWPAVPLNVSLPFWPGTVVVSATGAPPVTIVPVTSGGTSYSRSVTLPVLVPCGSTTIVYVPATASETASTKPPIVPIVVGATSVVPSGRSSETLTLQHVGPTLTATRWPAVPLNVSLPFCPATVVDRVAVAPPATIVPVTSGGTSYSCSVTLPMVVVCGSTRIVYVPATGSATVSTNPPKVPIVIAVPSVVPSGRRNETRTVQQLGPTARLTRCPAEPVNEARAF